MGSKTTHGPLCIACVEGLATIGYIICIANTISEETRTKPWQVDTKELVDDVVDTQEPTVEIKHPMDFNLETNTQEPTNYVADTQEPKIETEVSKEEKLRVVSQEPINESTNTQEPVAEEKQIKA